MKEISILVFLDFNCAEKIKKISVIEISILVFLDFNIIKTLQIAQMEEISILVFLDFNPEIRRNLKRNI